MPKKIQTPPDTILHQHLPLIEVAEPWLLESIMSDATAARYVVTRLSGRVAVVAPGQIDALLARLRKLRHTPKVLEDWRPMEETALRFDEYLPYVNSDVLKAAAKLWGGRGSERKDDAIHIIRAGLGTPHHFLFVFRFFALRAKKRNTNRRESTAANDHIRATA